jgi:hypothetical protein
MKRFHLFFVPLAITTAACLARPAGNPNAKSTADLDASQIDLDMSAQANDFGLRVYATPYNAGYGVVPLGSSDELQATLGSQTVAMVKYGVHYSASFPVILEGAEVTIGLLRSGTRQASLNSTVVVAPQFTVGSTPDKITDGDLVHFVVSPPPSQAVKVEMRFVGSDGAKPATCLDWPADKTFPVDSVGSDGTVTFSASKAFVRNPDHRLDPACDALAAVRYETNGSADPSLDSSSGVSGLREEAFQTRLVRVAGN